MNTGKTMKGVAAAFAVLFVMACSGCGGGGGGSAQPVAQPAPAVKSVVIDAQGDSTMLGLEKINGERFYTANTPPANLQKALQGALGAAVTVANNAVGESNVDYRMNGTNGYSAKWSAYLASDNAQIVISNWGMNDSNITPGVGISLDQFRTDLLNYIQLAQQAGKKVVLEEPHPSCDAVHPNMAQYVAVIDDIAAQQGLPLVSQYHYILSLPNWQSYLSADCVHPGDDRLYQIKAQREYDVLAPIVKAMQ